MREDFNDRVNEIMQRMERVRSIVLNDLNRLQIKAGYKPVVHSEMTRFGVYFSLSIIPEAATYSHRNYWIGETVLWSEWDILSDEDIAKMVRKWW